MDDSFKDGIPRESRKTGFLQSFDRQKLDPGDPADFASKAYPRYSGATRFSDVARSS